MRHRTKCKLIGLAGLLLAGPVASDWLVTFDGQRIETRGPWRLRGRTVVFTSADGRYASLRVADVDFEASRELTAAGSPTPSMAPPPPQARITLTGADIPRYRAPTAAAGDQQAGGEPEAAPTSNLRVSSWDRVDSSDFDGFEIVGQVENTGQDLLTGIRLEVTTIGTDGQTTSWQAFLDVDMLPPGKSSRFRLPLSADHWGDEVRFSPSGRTTLLRIESPIASED